MVIRDLSFSEIIPPTISTSADLPGHSPQVASVTDRFLAFVLDAFIFSPVVSFAVAGILRQLKTLLILNSESEEVVVIWAFFVGGIIIFSSLLQSLFLYFWGATPGQKFMQLHVVSYPHKVLENKNLSYAQCLLRSLGWWLGVGAGGLPFLEILGHPLRRAFHERASDTVVISLKKEPVDVPLAIESYYIRTTLWMCFGFMFLIALILSGKMYRKSLKAGFAGRPAISKNLCAEIPEDSYKGSKRLDLALALYFAGEGDEECVHAEAQQALWSLHGSEKALGQLAMSLISPEKEEAASYRKRVCLEGSTSAACLISKSLDLKEPERGEWLQDQDLDLMSARVLLLKGAVEQARYPGVVDLIQELDKETLLRPYLEKTLVRAAWALKDRTPQKSNSRIPASSEAEQQILEEFKKRYELK